MYREECWFFLSLSSRRRIWFIRWTDKSGIAFKLYDVRFCIDTIIKKHLMWCIIYWNQYKFTLKQDLPFLLSCKFLFAESEASERGKRRNGSTPNKRSDLSAIQSENEQASGRTPLSEKRPMKKGPKGPTRISSSTDSDTQSQRYVSGSSCAFFKEPIWLDSLTTFLKKDNIKTIVWYPMPSTHTTLFWCPYDVVFTLWTLYGRQNNVVCVLCESDIWKCALDYWFIFFSTKHSFLGRLFVKT